MTLRRVLVIWNPNAGRKAGLPTNRSSERELREALNEVGLTAELFRGESAAAAERRVSEALREDWDIIAGAGGDGTAHVIARQLLRSADCSQAGKRAAAVPALGVIPLGSAMNLAAAIGIPRDVHQAVRILAHGAIHAIDVGWLRDEPFFEVVAIGLGAEALERARAIDRRRHWGAIVEFIRLAARYRRTRIRIELEDGREIRARGLGLAIANGPTTGLRVSLAPEAKLDDGLLDVVLHEGVSPSGLVANLLRAIVSEQQGTFRSWRTTRVCVETRRSLAVYADGRDAGTTPVEISIRPGALRVVGPATTAAPASTTGRRSVRGGTDSRRSAGTGSRG